MSNRIYNIRKENLFRHYNLNHLEKYYDIDKYQILLKSIDDLTDKLVIQYLKKGDINEIKSILSTNVLRCNQLQLPIELNRIIITYIQEDYLNINIKVECPEHYPFVMLNWTLINTETNIISKNFTAKQLNKFLTYHVESFNDLLKQPYNEIPTMGIDKLIVLFVSNIYVPLDYFIG